MTKPGVYRHYKGPLYRVLFTALESTNSRAREPVVVYVSLEKGSINVRREAEFHELLSVLGYGARVRRFELVEEAP